MLHYVVFLKIFLCSSIYPKSATNFRLKLNYVYSAMGLGIEHLPLMKLRNKGCSLNHHKFSFSIAAGLIIKNVSIELSSSSPTAGEELRMTCSAVSDVLATLTWTDPRGDRVTTNNPQVSLELVDGELSLLFQSLHTSHGGVYTCVASVGGISSAQKMAAEHLLAIQSEMTRGKSFYVKLYFYMQFLSLSR